jgi:hypothetical protein
MSDNRHLSPFSRNERTALVADKGKYHVNVRFRLKIICTFAPAFCLQGAGASRPSIK